MEVNRKKRRRGLKDAQAILRITGALSISTLKGLGFRKGDIERWVRNKDLYLPYGKNEPEVIMVKR